MIKQFGLHTSTKLHDSWTEVRTRPTNNGGIPVARPIFGGHDVEVTFDRVNGVPLALAQFLEDNWTIGNPDIVVTLQITIRNADGSIDQAIYSDGIMYISDGGDWKGVDVVPMTMKFFFQRRQVVSTQPAFSVGGQAIGA